MTKQFDLKKFIIAHMIEMLLILLIVGMAIGAPSFLSTNNVLNIFRNVSLKGVVAIGMTLVIIAGEIDLSIGSQVALGGVITGYVSKLLIDQGMAMEYSALIGLLIAVVAAILVGIFHGVALYHFRMPSFIITLATQSIMYGLAAIICGGFPIINVYPEWYNYIGIGKIFGAIPFQAFVLIIIFFIGWFLMEKTDLGRSIYAVGGNAESARLSRHQRVQSQDLCHGRRPAHGPARRHDEQRAGALGDVRLRARLGNAGHLLGRDRRRGDERRYRHGLGHVHRHHVHGRYLQRHDAAQRERVHAVRRQRRADVLRRDVQHLHEPYPPLKRNRYKIRSILT